MWESNPSGNVGKSMASKGYDGEMFRKWAKIPAKIGINSEQEGSGQGDGL